MLGATTKPPTRRVASDANASPPRFGGAVGSHHAGEGTAIAADASASQVRAFIDTALSAVADQKRSPSADLEFAVFRSGTQSPPFNPHQVGTDEWYAHGQRTGFWVNLKTSERFVDRPLMRSVLRTLVDQLQAINDMLAKMATGGVAKADVQAVARSVLSETSLTEADLDNEPASVKDRAAAFGGLYAHMFILDDRRFYSDIVEDLEANGHPVAGRKRRVQSWGQAALQHMTDYMNDQDIETPDADKRRSDAFRDVMRGFDDVADAIGRLPWEAQDQAWTYYHEQVEGILDGIQDELVVVRTFDWFDPAEEDRRAPPPAPSGVDLAVEVGRTDRFRWRGLEQPTRELK